MKICTKCNIEKPKTEFHKQSRNKNGIQPKCKACDAIQHGLWYEKNKEASNLQHNFFYRENKESIIKRQRIYRTENPEKLSAQSNLRRSRKSMAEGSHAASDIKSIFNNQRGLCANCEAKLFKSGKQKYHVDHIMPLSRGGSNDKYNLQCLCPDCNLRKHAKHPDAWAKENGRLL